MQADCFRVDAPHEVSIIIGDTFSGDSGSLGRSRQPVVLHPLLQLLELALK